MELRLRQINIGGWSYQRRVKFMGVDKGIVSPSRNKLQIPISKRWRRMQCLVTQLDLNLRRVRNVYISSSRLRRLRLRFINF